MKEEELMQYILFCVIFHHKFDESYKITQDARAKEEELFQKSIDYLDKLNSHITKLETQIKKMKCCENCKFNDSCLHCACGENFAGWEMPD